MFRSFDLYHDETAGSVAPRRRGDVMAGAPFPPDEYADRVVRIQRAMREDELDGILLTEVADFEYVTGYQVRVMWSSYTRILAVLVPADGPPVLLVPDFVADVAADVSGCAVRTYGRIDRAPIAELAALVAESTGTTARIGTELGPESRLGMPVETLRELGTAVPGVTFVDASRALLGVRMRKSDAEIERLRRACRANSHAFATVFGSSLDGHTELDVARRLTAAALDAGAEWDGWTIPGWVAITSGADGYHRFLGQPRPRPLEAGDMVWADLGVTVDGYWSDFCRAAVLGGPTPRQVDRQERILEATAAGIEHARPGARASDVASAVGRALVRGGLAGFGFGRVGHGIGLTATEPPHVARYDDTVLEAGMVITVEPATVADDGLYCAEQVVVVGDPPEILSTAPGTLGSV
jgi:Xaa-Pro aminopeptidase